MHNVYNISVRKWRMIHRRWLNVHRREFPFSLPSTHPSILLISSLRSLSCQGKVVSSALSKHPSSGSSGFQRILQTSPFIHFPLRTKRWQPQADEYRTLACYLTYYVIIPFFFRGEDLTLDSFRFCWQPNVIIRAVFADNDKMISSKAG